MGKWVIGSGSSKIKPIPFNTRVYGYTGKRVWVQSNPFHTRLIGSGPGRVWVWTRPIDRPRHGRPARSTVGWGRSTDSRDGLFREIAVLEIVSIWKLILRVFFGGYIYERQSSLYWNAKDCIDSPINRKSLFHCPEEVGKIGRTSLKIVCLRSSRF